jgi:hypothetical protein
MADDARTIRVEEARKAGQPMLHRGREGQFPIEGFHVSARIWCSEILSLWDFGGEKCPVESDATWVRGMRQTKELAGP